MLKIGVLGAGHLGFIHIKLLLQVEGVEVIGCYDPDEARMAKAALEFGIPKFDSMQALLEVCDAVDIIASTSAHYECAIAGLNAGLHVFIEKPIAALPIQADEIVKLAESNGLNIQVGHVERFNPAFLAVKDREIRPYFIEAHRLSQFNPRGTDVSVVMDLMIHDIDVVLSMVKSKISHISASGVGVISDSPDIANARIEFENGCVANLTASRISLKTMRRMRLFQRDAYITIDFAEKQAQVLTLSDKQANTEEGLPFIEVNTGDSKTRKYIRFEQPEAP
ncbi:MAG: putative dehydrogenase, partial [Limisphaerales bacterium]